MARADRLELWRPGVEEVKAGPVGFVGGLQDRRQVLRSGGSETPSSGCLDDGRVVIPCEAGEDRA
jgi:hypothetical protein